MPAQTPSPIVSAHSLTVSNLKDFVIVDAGSGDEAFARYREAHIEGAVYADLNRHLAAVPQDAANGGRHPLPDICHFAAFLGSIGISPQKHVLVYDDKNGSNAAARFWWMLKAVGHVHVQVINGGLQAAIAAGIPVSSKITHPAAAGPYPVTGWTLPTATLANVEEASTNNTALIVDVREAARFNGITEPIDPVAGCIPGAVNMPFRENLDAQGLFLSPEALKEKCLPLFQEHRADDIIVHCGSGVTACHTLLAIDYAGLPLPRLYTGSWSEWCRQKYC